MQGGLSSSPPPPQPLLPDVGEGEVLSGAELYHYLLEENTNQLDRAATKIAEYTALKATLGSITERCRRSLLAPVANGLAYFEAELETTNNILVLLGDGWFAERSAAQAAEIAQRRLDFLRREQQVLLEEKKNLEGRQELFLNEVPGAEEAARKLSSATMATKVAPRPSSSTPENAAAAASPEGNAAADGAGSLADLQDPELTTFDEQDELTEEELIALEEELADHIEDDEYVEKVMLERMIAKKEARVRAELARRQEQPPLAAASTIAGDSDVLTSTPLPAASTSEERTTYRTPADIMAAYAAAEAARVRACTPAEPGEVTEAQSTTEASQTNGEVEKEVEERTPARKSMTFSETVDVRHVDKPVTASMTAPALLAPVPPRATYAVGDIFEHVEGEGGRGGLATGARAAAGGVPPLHPVFFSAAAAAPGPVKRRSLFAREREGE